MSWANELTAVIAVILLALVAWGYRPPGSHFWRDAIFGPMRSIWGMLCNATLFWWPSRPHWLRDDEEALLEVVRNGIFYGALFVVVRMGYHDIWRAIQRGIDAFSLSTQLFNAGCNGLAIVAALYLLRARWLAIPREFRPDYTWLTAPFYPRESDVRRAMAREMANELRKGDPE